MASFARVEVFLGFKHSLELKDLSSGERCSHLLPTRLPIRTRLERKHHYHLVLLVCIGFDIDFQFEAACQENAIYQKSYLENRRVIKKTLSIKRVI